MEENTEDFQEMLNIMKVQEFKEAKEQKKLASVFAHLKRGSNQKAQLFYKNTVYAKVLNAFMIARLQSIQYNHRLNIFYEQLQNTYFRMQLQTHFEAMKQFKNIRYQQRDQKIKIVLQQRKKNQLKSFCNTMRHIVASRKQKRRIQIQITPIKEAYKTDSLFNKQRRDTNIRNDSKQAMSKQNFYKKQLQQSRNSVKSVHSMSSQLGGRRKFAAIKELPKFPQLEEIQQKYPQKTEEQQRESNNQFRQVTNKTKILQEKKVDSSRISSVANEEPYKTQIEQKLEKQKPIQKSSSRKLNKDSILAIISRVKMLEVVQLTEIINQYSNCLKFESLISEKAFLSQSIETLHRIIKL